MRAQATSLPFGNKGFPATRSVGARVVSTARRRTLEPRNRLAWRGAQLESTTSIMVTSVSAVRRELGISATLDAVEMACAETYRQTADRERYLAARTLLRHALSKTAGGQIAPKDWRYTEGRHGKPMMAAGLPALEFNVSHSENCVAVAISSKEPIGIDIECLDPDRRTGIVYEILTEVERDRLRKLTADEQWGQFVRIWTAKEACSKALGLGLSLDFQVMEVQMNPLRVRLLDRPASAPAVFDLASTTVSKNGRAYSLSVARILDGALASRARQA
jgi:phosphopantetheine--protein transferase-like protein